MPTGQCKFPHITKKDLALKAKVYAQQYCAPPRLTTESVTQKQEIQKKTFAPPLPVKPMILSFRDLIKGPCEPEPEPEPEKAIAQEPDMTDSEDDTESASEDEEFSENASEAEEEFTQVIRSNKFAENHIPRFPKIVCKYFLMLDPFTQHHKCKHGISGVNHEGHCPNLHPCYYFYIHGKCDKPKGTCKYPHVTS
jgi:hypothetical protein